jgi:hypothetical protein
MGYEYGYHWWINPYGGYQARGYGGQRIIVLPDQQLVVVFTGGFFDNDMETVPDALLITYIIPAAKSKSPLPPNPAQTGLLDTRINALANPAPKPISSLPAIAANISGKTYQLEPNSLDIKTVQLSFVENQASANVILDSPPQALSIGLDGLSRLTRVNQPGGKITSYYLKGSWVNSDTFLLSAIWDGAVAQMSVTFNGNSLLLDIFGCSEIEHIYGTLQQ